MNPPPPAPADTSEALPPSDDPPGGLTDLGEVTDEVEKRPSTRVRIGVGAGIVLVVVALVISVLVTAISPVGATTVFDPAGAAPGASASPAGPSASPSVSPPGAGALAGDGSGVAAETASGGAGAEGAEGEGGAGDASRGVTLLVHVLGAVRAAGVYEVDEGARVIDAVTAAGGLAEGADQASVNLARAVVDGEQIRVLAVGEVPPAGQAPAGGSGTGEVPGASGSSGGPGGGGGGGGGGLVNLNSATALDLDALPRIGPAMAQRILDWREANGSFTSVDELGEVSGIGDKTLESLRPLVTV